MPTQTITQALRNESPELARLVGQVEVLNELLSLVRNALPPEIAARCFAATPVGNTLHIAVNHSAAAAMVRIHAPDILAALHKAGWQTTAIQAKVQVALQQKKANAAKSLQLSSTAQESFAKLADELAPSSLRDSILTLLQHHHR